MRPNSGLLVSEKATGIDGVAPEMRLFRHIILNAVLDAIYGSCLTYENSSGIKAAAMRWFYEADEDFQLICECADLHPEQVRRDALRYIAAQREALPANSRRPNLHCLNTGRRLAA